MVLFWISIINIGSWVRILMSAYIITLLLTFIIMIIATCFMLYHRKAHLIDETLYKILCERFWSNVQLTLMAIASTVIYIVDHFNNHVEILDILSSLAFCLSSIVILVSLVMSWKIGEIPTSSNGYSIHFDNNREDDKDQP